MTKPLSSAAQAVMNACTDAPIHINWATRCAAAAALQAAVDLVLPDKCPPIEDFNEFDQGYAMAHITYRQALLAIVDELGGTKYGTYRCNILDKK